jgi:hypothetical protein
MTYFGLYDQQKILTFNRKLFTKAAVELFCRVPRPNINSVVEKFVFVSCSWAMVPGMNIKVKYDLRTARLTMQEL